MKMNEAVEAFYEGLDEVYREYDEVTDTDVREALYYTVARMFIEGRPDGTLPTTLRMMSERGDKMLLRVMERFLDDVRSADDYVEYSSSARRTELMLRDRTTKRGTWCGDLFPRDAPPKGEWEFPADLFEAPEYEAE